MKSFTDFIDFSIVLVPLLNTNIKVKRWYKIVKYRQGFAVIITFWTFVGLFLSRAYRSTLLASLIKRDIEKSPETFQELLDAKFEVYMAANPVFTSLLEFSPFEVQRKVWKEGVLQRGGLYQNAIIPPKVVDRIRDGYAATIRGDDILLEHGHIMKRGKEPLQSMINAGYYYDLKLPLKKELDRVLLTFKDCGVLDKVDH